MAVLVSWVICLIICFVFRFGAWMFQWRQQRTASQHSPATMGPWIIIKLFGDRNDVWSPLWRLCKIQKYPGWCFGTWIFFFHSVANGKSSQLTFTPSFFRGVAKTTNQMIFLAQHPSYPHIVGWCRGSESKTSITPKLYPWESHETSILVWLEYQDTSIIIPLLFHLHLIWKVQVPPCCSQPPFGFVKTAR